MVNVKSLEDVYDYLGPVSYYQIYLIILVSFNGILSSLVGQMVVFTQAVPEHFCRSNDGGLDFSKIPKIKNEKCGSDAYIYSQCQQYEDPTAKHAANTSTSMSTTKISCQNGYIWDNSTFSSTFVTEYNLVCTPSNLFFQILIFSIFYLGGVLGSFISGWISDTYGRKWCFISSLCVSVFSIVLAGFTQNIYTYLFFRFLQGAARSLGYIAASVYLIEIIPKKYRSAAGFSIHQTYGLGEIVIAGLAFYIRDWRVLCKSCIIFLVPVFLMMRIPESPAFLFSKGELEEASRVYMMFSTRKSASVEKVEEILVELSSSTGSENHKQSKQHQTTIKDLFTQSKNLILIIAKTSFLWTANSIIMDGLSLGVDSLPGSIFTSVVIYGVIDLLSNLISPRLIDLKFLGRRYAISGGHFLASLCCLGTTLTVFYMPCDIDENANDSTESINNINLAFSFLGRFFITGAGFSICQWMNELFPTPIRSNGLAFAQIICKLGSTVTPAILVLREIREWLPGLVFCVLGLMTGFVSVTLPETRDVSTLSSFEEAEKLYLVEKKSRKISRTAT